MTGKDPEPYTNEYIEWGIEQEAPAKELYMKRTGTLVQEVGFVDHPSVAMAGASPDGLVGDDGLIEIKCPTTANHIETILSEEVKEQYRLQMLWQMACTGRKWCDFVSYDPRLPEDMQLYVQRFERDDKEIEYVEQEVDFFLREVEHTVEELTKKFRKDKDKNAE